MGRQRRELPELWLVNKALVPITRPPARNWRHVCKGRIELLFGAGIEDMEFQPEGAGRRQRLPRFGLGNSGIGRVDEQSHDARLGE